MILNQIKSRNFKFTNCFCVISGCNSIDISIMIGEKWSILLDLVFVVNLQIKGMLTNWYIFYCTPIVSYFQRGKLCWWSWRYTVCFYISVALWMSFCVTYSFSSTCSSASLIRCISWDHFVIVWSGCYCRHCPGHSICTFLFPASPKRIISDILSFFKSQSNRLIYGENGEKWIRFQCAFTRK